VGGSNRLDGSNQIDVEHREDGLRIVWQLRLRRLMKRLAGFALKERHGRTICVSVAAIFVVSVVLRVSLSNWLEGPTFMVFFPGIVLGTLVAGVEGGVFLLFGFGFFVFYAIMPPAFTFVLAEDGSAVQLAVYFVMGGLIVLVVWSLTDLMRRLQHETAVKETLFRELQHRVANNLQVVAFSLRAAAREANSEGPAIQSLAQAVARVSALGTLHRRIYDAASYQEGLLPVLREILSQTLKEFAIDVVVDVAPVKLTLDQMTAIVLLVNEAAMNAAKHVFRSAGGTRFEVRLRDRGDGRLRLVIRDNGPGISCGAATNGKKGGLGVKIMRALSRQLGGVLETASGPGTMFNLDFLKQASAHAWVF
jgi:two-component system, sensor histidine kinase PdtaS